MAGTFAESVKYFPGRKVVHTGNMIREEFCKAEALAPTTREKFVVLVLGGSQGAQAINRAMAEALDALAPVKEQLHIIHQTGNLNHEIQRLIPFLPSGASSPKYCRAKGCPSKPLLPADCWVRRG